MSTVKTSDLEGCHPRGFHLLSPTRVPITMAHVTELLMLL